MSRVHRRRRPCPEVLWGDRLYPDDTGVERQYGDDSIPERSNPTFSEAKPEQGGALRRRRRGRTLLLIATAAVLGVVAGTVTGYAVQSDRPPTPLRPLAQPLAAAPVAAAGPARPNGRGVDVHRWHRTDGDL